MTKLSKPQRVVSQDKLDTLELYCEAKNRVIQLTSKSYSLLDEILTKIHRQGNLGDVEIALDKIDRTVERYQRQMWRRFFLPAPYLLIQSVKDRFREQPTISRVQDTFDPGEKSDIWIANFLYCITAILFLISIVCLSIFFVFHLLWPSLVSISVFIVVYWINYWFSGIIIDQKLFVPLYTRIRDSVLRRVKAQEELIENSYKIPEAIEQRMLEYEKNSAFNQLAASEKGQIKRLEYEGLEKLQGIAAAVALHQARTDAQVKHINNIPELKHMESVIRIKSPERAHQIILAEINAMERILTEKVKAIANNDLDDREMQRDIERWQAMCRGWRGKLRRGSAGIPEVAEEVEAIAKSLSLHTTSDT